LRSETLKRTKIYDGTTDSLWSKPNHSICPIRCKRQGDPARSQGRYASWMSCSNDGKSKQV
jgi:hypothetical protein